MHSFIPALVLAMLFAGCTSAKHSGAPPATGSTRSPVSSIDPSNFVAVVDNPWFSLKPGTTFVYEGVKDGKQAVMTTTVTAATKVILGVTCAVVKDTLTLAGHLEESTEDWYTQDIQGNVWYFGEATETLDEKGKVKSRAGSWEAGVDGAEPGIYFPAVPKVGESHRQEYYKGHAEDHFEIVDLNSSRTVPAGRYTHAVRTREWTPIEPGAIDYKYFVRDTGMIEEGAVDGSEALKLVSVSRAS